jgi:AraC-like DNA-binding protein
MIKIKEGFKDERMLSLPEELLRRYADDPLIGDLYVRKMGFFPAVKYHYIQKEKGCDYHLLLYCTEGEGWYETGGKRYIVGKNQFVILPRQLAYDFGANNENPWTIYWLHFKGSKADLFGQKPPRPQAIEPGEESRINHRIDLFEELYAAFSLAYQQEYMAYASVCLHMLLASFTMLEQYRHFAHHASHQQSFSARVIYYMQENINRNLKLDELARYFRYSPSHFSMLFKKETGASPMEHFIRMKIQKACQYIELTDFKFKEISVTLGFDDPSYFSRLFTKVMGTTPTDFALSQCTIHNT